MKLKHKTETLNLRVSSEVKSALKIAAVKEHRSLANMVESLIYDYIKRHELEIKIDSEINSIEINND
jgi:predicted transcriptional regulator